MESIKERLVELLVQDDSKRDRSLQVNIGPSEIGGCSRRMWYRINKTEPTNLNTLRLAAIMGTAIHTLIESIFSGQEGFITEAEVSHEGVTGHIDLIDTNTNTIWDWKTTTKGSLAWFPSEQQKEQVQIYGYLANKNGMKVENVGLVAIARDGNENDILEHVEAYDEAKALNCLAKLKEVQELFEAPAPEKEVAFCEKYCQFFGECSGKVESEESEKIENLETIKLVQEYVELNATIKKLNGHLDFAKTALEGTRGITPDGILVKWSQVAGRSSVDEKAITEALGFVPKKQGNGYMRLTVK